MQLGDIVAVISSLSLKFRPSLTIGEEASGGTCGVIKTVWQLRINLSDYQPTEAALARSLLDVSELA